MDINHEHESRYLHDWRNIRTPEIPPLSKDGVSYIYASYKCITNDLILILGVEVASVSHRLEETADRRTQTSIPAPI